MKKLAWKQKNRLLAAGVLLLLWVIYAFAVNNTIHLRNACNTLQQQLDSASGAPARLEHLRGEMAQLETITGDTSGALHERLLGIVTEYCKTNNLTLRDFAPPFRYREQEWIVETHPVTVEGDYIALLKLVFQLEKAQTGKVVSVDFHSKQDNKTKTLSLLVTIYVQNIIRDHS